MKRRIVQLLALLLVQAAVIVVLYRQSPEPATAQNEALVPVAIDSIDEIYIADPEENEAVLLRLEGQWLLPDFSGMPVDRQKLDALLSAVGGGSDRWPLATSTGARQRFQVADYLFQKRLTLISEGELKATVYLGTSPGFRRVHARRDGSDAIYSIPFNSHDAPAQDTAWLDSTLLQESKPTSLQVAGATLLNNNDEWQAADGGNIDQRELAALLLALQTVQVSAIVDEQAEPALAIAAPQISITIGTETGKRTLELFDVGGKHYARSSRFDYFFSINNYDYQRFAGIEFDRLVR